jgi:protein-tyrosine phosphatase
MIIDLRAGREIDHRPDKRISTVHEIIHIDIHDAARDKAEQFLAENDAEGLENVLIGDYRRMVRAHQTDFKKFLDILAFTENLPLLYHCAAGKDRTGMATVFLLHALGADPDAIWKDYMETNIRTAAFVEKIIKKVNEAGQNGSILRPLLEVRREYLQSAMDEMELHYGGLDHYVRNILKADVDRLRERYLEQNR